MPKKQFIQFTATIETVPMTRSRLAHALKEAASRIEAFHPEENVTDDVCNFLWLMRDGQQIGEWSIELGEMEVELSCLREPK